MPFHRQLLANGLQIIGESNPAALSAAVCFWVRTGARDEVGPESGVSHFLEHMVFKGTEKRDALTVNRDFSKIGADNNAWTSEENTVFHAVVLPEYLGAAIELLADIMRPSLRLDDFETEKKVILDEIVRYDIQPAWASYDAARKNYYGDHALGNSVLGTSESITALTRDQMQGYFDRRYLASNIVVVVSGNFDWNAVVREVEQCTKHWPTGTTTRQHLPHRPQGPLLKVHQKPEDKVTQQYVTLIAPGPAAASPLGYASALVTGVIGDYSGSRMFWAITDPGLADDAGMGFDECDGAGAYYTSFNCTPENAQECYAIVEEILHDVQRNGITEAEFQLTKTKVLSREIRAGERTARRMSAIAKDWVYRGELRTVDDELKAWDAVTLADVRQVLDEFPLTNTITTAFGPLESLK